MQWTTPDTDEALAEELAQGLRVSKTCGQLLAQLGFRSKESAEDFLRPRLAHLDDPFALTNLEAAADRIVAAVNRAEDVVVFGDYDVDGITSTVQLVGMLRRLGLEPRFCVPRRLEEGYGLSREAMERVFDGRFPQLFIALDCGTNAHEPIAYLADQGIDVIVIDHHQAKEEPAGACTMVNPHVHDTEDAPWRHLCTAGLVFKLLHGLLRKLREADDPRVETIQLKDTLDLVALGTIADLVPLHRENRILSWYGLHHLRANGRVGVRALAEVSGIDGAQEMSSADISFKLGPRINACGRLADASRPIELLLGKNADTCREVAKELDALNKERQSIERGITQVAEARAGEEFADLPGVILYDKDWHPGVVGIVASRVSRHLHKPCVILGAEGDMAKGSGRSVANVDLVEVFHRCSHLLDHWGGHPMAAGVSLKAENVEDFTRCFNDSLLALHPDGLPEASLAVSAWLDPDDLNIALLEELARLHPFGQGNPEPVFGLQGVCLDEAPITFGQNNFRFRLPDGSSRGIAGIAWNLGEPPEAGQPINMALRFAWNHWRGKRYPQVTLIDWKNS
ncbi:single-stranded-DNA-specific exonuclease RecJ [Coraliomargarita sinensis]|uniref:Single-stranded-DNA-specific exonuclease RecJ n=1 Tax=Coraliomargarita sinensis TaxID=2174842 RepID=A0A317ZN59_9BACT|nr:single-stranded-DNA-specific exonuclease RecJ [Coraliomargarita sinensis]PXA05673.1 single-stranded-DNA-specific exonuclease RecJ [Coraliomargarita sinensis]